MSVMSKARSCAASLLLIGGLASGSLAGCAVFGSQRESTVAQGKYYASGDPYYDQFFVDLYMLQVGMAEAPKVPEAERQRWITQLQLEPQATPAMIELRLHEAALKLSQAGIHLRLDQSSVSDKPETASTVIRSNARPKENPAAALLASVELSSTNLLRWQLAMKQKEEALGRLELLTVRLDGGIDRAFSQAPVGKPSEVKENLADAHKLIPLMRARAAALHANTEQLLAALTHGINTDDGSIGPPIGADSPKTDGASEANALPDGAKKASGKPHPRPKPVSAAAAPTPATKPAPTPAPKRPAAAGDSDEPTKARPATKPAPPPRDFEP